jgi:hypothetical protein
VDLRALAFSLVATSTVGCADIDTYAALEMGRTDENFPNPVTYARTTQGQFDYALEDLERRGWDVTIREGDSMFAEDSLNWTNPATKNIRLRTDFADIGGDFANSIIQHERVHTLQDDLSSYATDPTLAMGYEIEACGVQMYTLGLIGSSRADNLVRTAIRNVNYMVEDYDVGERVMGNVEDWFQESYDRGVEDAAANPRNQ